MGTRKTNARRRGRRRSRSSSSMHDHVQGRRRTMMTANDRDNEKSETPERTREQPEERNTSRFLQRSSTTAAPTVTVPKPTLAPTHTFAPTSSPPTFAPTTTWKPTTMPVKYSKFASPLPDVPDFIPRDCATSDYPRLIHDAETWQHLQDLYYEDSFYPRRKKTTTTGFKYDIVVRDHSFRGRGVYANEEIPADVRVYGHGHAATFHTPYEWIAFLRRVEQHHLLCDLLLWGYVSKGTGEVSLAMDAGSYVNHGSSNPLREENNLDTNCFSTRRIHKGEELLQNYTDFIGYHELDWFDHIRDVAWNEGEVSDIVATEAYNVMGAPKQHDATGSYSQHQSSKLRKTGGNHHDLDEVTTAFYQHIAMIKVIQGPLILMFLLCAYLIRKKATIAHSLRNSKSIYPFFSRKNTQSQSNPKSKIQQYPRR